MNNTNIAARRDIVTGVDSNDPALNFRRKNTVRRALNEIERDAGRSGDKSSSRKLRSSVIAFASGILTVGVIITAIVAAPLAASKKADGVPDWLPSGESEAEQTGETIFTPDEDIYTDIQRVTVETTQSDDGEVFAAYTAPTYAAAPASSSSGDGRYTVTLSFYGDSDIVVSTPPVTVAGLLESTGVVLDENQLASLPMAQYITSDTVIEVDEVSYTYMTVTETVPYEVTYEDVKTIPRGTTSTAKAGVNGTITHTYKLELLNGEEISRELTSSQTTAYAQNALVYRGVGGTVTGADGIARSYSYYIQVTATTYTGGGITYTGRPAAEGLIAVDPKVIPLNTHVYVKGNYGDFGECIAADIGGGIKGNIIDVYLDEDNPYFANFGLRRMYVYILD